MRQKNLVLLFQDRQQLDHDCFIKQLHFTLKKHFTLTYISEEKLMEGEYNRLQKGDKVLSVLRLRRWRPLIPYLGKIADKADLYLYDQDPWEAYHDEGSCRGVYETISQCIKVKAFLITSHWWAKYIAARVKPRAAFVRMGAVAHNCNVGPSFEQRQYELGFQGTVHNHRQQFFTRLSEQGLPVSLLKRVDFETFLKTVQQVGIYIYDDSAALKIAGEEASFHGLWGKCLTVAARGCFVIRNHDLSYDAYQIGDIPTVFTYKDESEIQGIVDKIRLLSPAEREKRMRKAVKMIKERDDWASVAQALESI